MKYPSSSAHKRFLLALIFAIGCASSDGFHTATFDGSEGPLDVEFADFTLQRMGSRPGDAILGTVSLDITNNSDTDVTVTKIAIAQRGMSTLRLETLVQAFDRVVEEGRTSRFDVTGRVSLPDVVIDRRDTVLNLRVDVTLSTHVTYEYEFDVPVSGTEF